MTTLQKNLPLTLLMLALTTQAFAAKGSPAIEVLGHRGARASRPENTLPAFSFAIEHGVDTLEMDVQLTKDHHLVVIHDETLPADLCRTMDASALAGPLRVRDLTLQELKNFDCGSLRHHEFANQATVPKTPIPTLDEVFQLIKTSPFPKARTVRLQIEAKATPRFAIDHASPESLAEAVLTLVAKYDLSNRVTIQSFDHRVLRAAKTIDGRVGIAALLGNDMPDWVAVAKAAEADTVSPHMNWVTPEAVRFAQKAGIKVIPYTANSVEDWSYLIDCGVDGIITDDPLNLINYLHRK